MIKKNKNSTNIKNINDLFITSYIIPLFFIDTLSTMIIGSFYSMKYSIVFKDFQARAIAFLFFIFGVTIFYNLYIKIPKRFNDELFKKYLSLVKSEPFFYILAISLLLTVYIELYVVKLRFITFLPILVMNFIFQLKFNKKYRKIL